MDIKMDIVFLFLHSTPIHWALWNVLYKSLWELKTEYDLSIAKEVTYSKGYSSKPLE